MEIHRQTCQKCGSHALRNILARAAGESDKVYVQCLECDDLVARYTIAPRGYYHHGKGFESYLRGIARSGHMDSGKDLRAAFKNIRERCLGEFNTILEKEKKLEDEQDSGDE